MDREGSSSSSKQQQQPRHIGIHDALTTWVTTTSATATGTTKHALTPQGEKP